MVLGLILVRPRLSDRRGLSALQTEADAPGIEHISRLVPVYGERRPALCRMILPVYIYQVDEVLSRSLAAHSIRLKPKRQMISPARMKRLIHIDIKCRARLGSLSEWRYIYRVHVIDLYLRQTGHLASVGTAAAQRAYASLRDQLVLLCLKGKTARLKLRPSRDLDLASGASFVCMHPYLGRHATMRSDAHQSEEMAIVRLSQLFHEKLLIFTQPRKELEKCDPRVMIIIICPVRIQPCYPVFVFLCQVVKGIRVKYYLREHISHLLCAFLVIFITCLPLCTSANGSSCSCS